jgi:deoxyhypusine synthase
VASREEYLSKKLVPIEVGDKSVSGLLEAMGKTGFQGKKLAEALDVWTAMAQDPDTTIFLGYAGSMSTTGQWKIVKWLIENRYIDVLVSTGANISEDVFEAMGKNYYQGSHLADDVDLLKNQIDRYYDVYADELEYRKMERLIYSFLETLDEKERYSSADFLDRFGAFQAQKGIHSITAAAHQHGVPVFSPGMADSGYGVAAYLYNREKGRHVTVDQFRDFEQLGAIGDKAKETAVIYLGGGVPKDTIQLVTVMVDLARGGEQTYPHKYAIQVTTDSPQWGGLSGCTFEEAVSWGKIDERATKAVCYCDATIALPILAHGLHERLKGRKRKGPDLSWVFKR